MAPKKYKRGQKKNSSKINYKVSILNKMMKSTTSDLVFTTRAINHVDIGYGFVGLEDRTTAISGVNSLPLICIPLRNIINGGTTGAGIYTLLQNGYDFNPLMAVEFAGGRNIDVNPTAVSNFENLLHRWTSIRLLLWQHGKKDAIYHLKLLKFNHASFDICGSPTTTNGDIQDKRRLFFYFQSLRSQLTNPLLKGEENYMRDIKDHVSILWSKTIKISEQSADLEEKHYEEIKLFKRYDQMIKYTASPTVLNDTIPASDNPDNVLFTSQTEGKLSSPNYRDNIFLMITSNSSVSDRDSAGAFDVMSFDLSLKSMYTTQSQNLYNV